MLFTLNTTTLDAVIPTIFKRLLVDNYKDLY